MEKDINVLLETTNDEIFEEQCKNWAGIEVFRACAWACQCHEHDCFRRCVQIYGREFPSAQMFAQYLDEIVGIDTRAGLQAYTDDFAKRVIFGKTLH